MLIRTKRRWEIAERLATSESLYVNRRRLLQGLAAGPILAAAATALGGRRAFGEEADVPALKGWRRKVFGEDAIRLRAGEICLALNGDRVAICEKGEMARATAES